MVTHALTFTQGDFTYETVNDSVATLKTLSSSGTGKTYLKIPGYTFCASTQKYYQVKEIAEDAFQNNTTVTEVRIGPGVEKVNSYAFYGCYNLATVSLPSTIKQLGNWVFYNCPITLINCAAETMPTFSTNTFSSMKSVSTTRAWWEGTTAGYNAASASSTITGIFSVAKNAPTAYDVACYMGSSSPYYRCYVYAIVTKAWSPVSQRGGECKIIYATPHSNNTTATLEVPYNTDLTDTDWDRYEPVEIADYAFQYTTQIKKLLISAVSDFKKIGTYAFQNCTSLTSVTLSAKTIGNYAFENCTNLTNVQLYGSNQDSYSVQSLGTECFKNTGITYVTIPKGLTTYGSGAFDCCPNLTDIYVNSSNTSFAVYKNGLYSKDYTTLYQYPSARYTYTFHEDAHYSLTKINAYAFKGNTKISTLRIPYGVTNIGSMAFGDMTKLEQLYVPSSVTTFSWNAFVNLTALKHFYFNLKSIPTSLTYSNCFSNIRSGCVLHVPIWRTQLYSSTSPWSSAFTGGIVEDSHDHLITYNNGSALDYYLGFTVTSTASYTDTKVQSAAVDGQMCIVYGFAGTEGGFNGTMTLPNTVTLRGKTYMVTEVQREVFRNQTVIRKVAGGAGIKKIGALSFAGLTGCTLGFDIPNPVEFCDSALFNCWTPTITLGDRLERIGKDAFRQSAVKQVLMPPSVTSIGSRFVAGVNQLDSIRFSPNITEIPTQGLGWCSARYLVLPYGLKRIDSQAFFSDGAYIDGGYLGEPVRENVVVIPSSVNYIHADAFKYARHMDAIFLNCPYGVFTTSSKDNWQRRTDYNASNAYSWSGHALYVPAGQLEQYRNDPGIKAAWSAGGIQCGAFDFTTDNDFWSTMYRMTVVDATNKKAKYVYNWGTRSTVINVANYRTDHNSGITYTMVEIGDSCWVNRPAVTTVSIPSSSGITRIGAYAFKDCTGITGEISVPATVSSIGTYAFWNCTNLASVFLNRTSATTIGVNMFYTTRKNILYVPLNQFYNIANQTSSWLPNTASNRLLLPYVKPTSEWSAISVDVSDNILLPASGEFYYASSFNTSNYSLGKVQLENSKGIKGGEGMLLKGTAGTVYRFRRNDAVSNYSYVSPTTNYLKGVTGAASKTVTSTNGGPYYYTFDGTDKFDRVSFSASATVYNGEAYVQLATSVPHVYIDSDITTYNLMINGTQVTSENCSNLKVISGVSGTTVAYNPTTNTLTLSNATISTTNSPAISNNIPGLTIKVIGTNNLVVTTTNSIALQVMQNTTITGTGTLNAGSAVNSGCMVYTDKTLTINGGVQVKFVGKICGLYGYSTSSRMIISGAQTKLTANGTNNGSLYQLVTTMNDGLAITEPAGAYFNSNGTVLYNGNVVKNQNVVISKPAFTRGDVDGDGTVGIADVTALIDYIINGNTTGINLSAADADEDGTVGIADVTSIIDYILSGHW